MFRVHSCRQRRTDVLGELDKQRVDLLEWARRLFSKFDSGDVFRNREKGGELERLLRGANLGAVVGDVGGELQWKRGKVSTGASNR
jgi:hypothetical protein